MNFTLPDLAGPLSKGLISRWRLNEGAGIYAFDSSGHKNTATFLNMANPATATSGWSSEQIGKAPLFDGVNDRAVFTPINCGTIHTISFFLNPVVVGSVLIGGLGGNYAPYTDTATWYYTAQASTVTVAHGGITVGALTHIAIVRNGTAVTFYKNGIQVGTIQTLGANNTLTLSAIGSYEDGSFLTQGKFADVRIYNVALPAGNIALLASRTRWQVPRKRLYGRPIAGITFDAVSTSGYKAASSSYSWSHTNAGNFLAVDVSRLSAPGTTVTGITFNSDPLTFIGTQATGTDAGNVSMWRLVAPDVGTFDITVTLSAVAISSGSAVSYFGVHQTSPTEGFNGAQGTNVGAADASVVITSVADNCWIHAAVATDDTAITAGQTSRNNVTGAGGSGANEDFGPHTPAGAKTMHYTDVAALATWAIAGYAIRPATSFFGGDEGYLWYLPIEAMAA